MKKIYIPDFTKQRLHFPTIMHTIFCMIRDAVNKDLDQILNIQNQCFSNGWSRETFEQSLASENCRVLVEEEEGTLRGYAVVFAEQNEADLFALATAPAFRKKGIASSLLDTIQNSFGIKKISLELRASNEAAKQLYLKYGFRVDGIKRDYYTAPPENAILMVCALNPPLF